MPLPLPPLVLALLDALEEPALLVARQRTEAANRAARALLGEGLVDQDIRFAIRQPQALDAILSGRDGRFQVRGIGGIERNFEVVLTSLQDGLLLVRLVDRSARIAAEKAQVDFVANASHELQDPAGNGARLFRDARRGRRAARAGAAALRRPDPRPGDPHDDHHPRSDEPVADRGRPLQRAKRRGSARPHRQRCRRRRRAACR